jgi:putative transposase
MTIDERKRGWLNVGFHLKFREILTHTLFRYGLTCPIYCCMPDHFHLLWVGLLERSDQRLAVKYFRKQLNTILDEYHLQLQKQPYDRVLREDERTEQAVEKTVEYIARNPVRADLVEADNYREYPYMDCLIPGCPEIRLWQRDYWERFWRTRAYMVEHGLYRMNEHE